jgi:hypothetical protein
MKFFWPISFLSGTKFSLGKVGIFWYFKSQGKNLFKCDELASRISKD